MDTKLVKEIALRADELAKCHPEISATIGLLLRLIVDSHYELKGLITDQSHQERETKKNVSKN